MFQFIRKHQAIGLIFIGIVIVSFVIFFSPNQGSVGPTMPRGALGTIRGKPIDVSDYMEARKELYLSEFFRTGNWPLNDREDEQQILSRLFLLDEAKRMGISVSDDVVARRILEMPFVRDDRTGTFDASAYDQFLGILAQRGITKDDFENFIRHEAALQHLVQVVGLSGTLVPPRVAETRYRDNNKLYSAQLVMFSASNYLDQVNLDEASVAQFYTNRMADYRIPERVQVRYVKFPTTNFLEQADALLSANTNLNMAIDAEYLRLGPEAFRDEQGNPLSAEAAKADLKEQYRQQLAREEARKKAVEFANQLYRMEATPESLTQLANEHGLPVYVSLPFDQFRPPQDMQVPTTFNQAAFKLTQDEPFATPVVGEDGVYIFAFEQRIPSEFQPLEAVRHQVVESLRRTQSRSLAETAGRDFASSVTNAIAEGKSFEAAAAEANYSVITVTNVSRTTTSLPEIGPRLSVFDILRAASDLEPGQTSPFISAVDGGFVLHLTASDPIPEEIVASELPQFLQQARQVGRISSFMEWQRRRFAEAEVRGSARSATTNAAPSLN